jgi:hypothetical protein
MRLNPRPSLFAATPQCGRKRGSPDDYPAGTAAALHCRAAASPGSPSREGSAGHRPAGRGSSSGRRDPCAGRGAGRGGAAAALPAVSAARLAGGRAPLHLAQSAHQGGGGSRRPDAVDRGAAVVELAAPGLLSSGVRACVPPCRLPFPIPLADPLDSPLRRRPPVGVRG